MPCERFVSVAHDYFLGHLAPERVAAEDAHLAACADCSAFHAVCLELSCRELVEFLNDYLDDELAPERRAVFERHLGICSDCRRYVESYRRAMALGVRALGSGPPLGEPVPDELVRAILAARRA